MAAASNMENIEAQMSKDLLGLSIIEKSKIGTSDEDALRIGMSIPFDDYAIVIGDKITEMPNERPVGYHKFETVYNVFLFASKQSTSNDLSTITEIVELCQDNCWENTAVAPRVCYALTTTIGRVNPWISLSTNGARMMRYCIIEVRVIYFEEKTVVASK